MNKILLCAIIVFTSLMVASCDPICLDPALCAPAAPPASEEAPAVQQPEQPQPPQAEQPAPEPSAQLVCNSPYWPVAEGANWTYEDSDSTGKIASITETISNVQGDANYATFTQTDRTGGESKYKCENGAIVDLRMDWTVLPPENDLLTPGFNWLRPGGKAWQDKVLGTQQITIKAGTFDTVVICYNWGFGGCQMGDPHNPGYAPVLEYYARNVGLVLITQASYDEVNMPSSRYELVSYNIPGYTAQPAQPQQGQQQLPRVLPINVNASVESNSDGLVTINGDVDQSKTYAVIIDWGDGNSYQSTFPASHMYQQSGNYTIRFTDPTHRVVAGTDHLDIRVDIRVGPIAPLISNVVLRYDNSSGSMIIWQDIYFSDPDLDSNRIEYALVYTSLPGVQIRNGTFVQNGADTFVTGKWECGKGWGPYKVTLGAMIKDAAGNTSNQYQYTMDCP